MAWKDIEQKRKYQREWKAARRAKYLKDKSCVNCGSTENLRVDHINPEKKWTHRIWSYCWKKIYAELKKCQILCEPCHMEKTVEDIRKMRKRAHGTLDGYVKWHCRCPRCMAVGKDIKSEEWSAGLDISEPVE